MTKRIGLAACGFIVVAVPGFAAAANSFDAESLAKVQSAMDFCAQRNPADAAKFEEQAKSLVQGVGESDVTQLRNSADYKLAYEASLAALRDVSEPEAAEACDGIARNQSN